MTIANLLNTMEITEGRHTKTNEIIYLGSLIEKVTKEEFKKVLEEVKKYNGYYSKFTNSFVFNSKPEFNNNIVEGVKMAKKENKLNLMELTTYIEKDIAKNYNVKEIAKEIRTELKNRFKFIKFSVTSPRSSTIYINVKSAPFGKESEYMEAVLSYARKLVDNYNFCTCYDPYGDYGSSYNFYSHVTVDYDFEQIETTEEIKEMLSSYDVALIEKKEIERIEEEKKYQEYLLQRKEEEKQWQLKKEQEQKEVEYINNNVEVVEVQEEQQYYINNTLFANLNKNSNLERYQEEVNNGDYTMQTIKITREIHFNNEESLNLYSNYLLNGFDFIEGTGGSYTDDLRINSMTDYYNMTTEERKSVQWILKGIAVYYNNELKFVIDAQGYSYARYVGLVDENTTTTKDFAFNQAVTVEEVEELKIEANNIIEKIADIPEGETTYNTRKNLSDYIKNNSIVLNKSIVQQVTDQTQKEKLYSVLTQVDTNKDQFTENTFDIGEQLTIVKPSMIGGATISHINYLSHELKEYAQYKDNIKMTFNVKGKRGAFETNIHDEALIYRGHLNLPQSVLYDNTNGGKITKYGSFDNAAMEDIINYFIDTYNVKPTINTFKPIFR